MKEKIKVILFFILCSIFLSKNVQAEDVIQEGISIDGIDIGGLTEKEARQIEENYLKELEKTKVVVVVNEHKVITSLSDLGYRCKQDYAGKAANIGKEGNLIERYMDITDVQEREVSYEHSFSLDNEKLKEFVSKECTQYNIEAKNAKLYQRADGTVQIKSSKSGSKLVEDETIEKIRRTILEDWDRTSEIVISAITIEDMPAFTSETAADCQNLLGEFTTSYPNSNENRCKNIENSARLIDGTVLFPAQEFSMYKTLYPITEENGFEKAGSYSGGKVVQSVGGGICQTTTTLYNAVLMAELEVIQRNPHSMTVSYVEIGKDAAIAGTYKDLKFSNNWNTPVYIEAVTEGKSITFRLWGKEVRPENRTIEYVSEILETIQPPEDVITEDPNIVAGNGYVTQEPYIGYKAELYKIIKIDGKEEKREKVNYSEYTATPRYVTVGTAGAKGRSISKDKRQEEKVEYTDGLKQAAASKEETEEQES